MKCCLLKNLDVEGASLFLITVVRRASLSRGGTSDVTRSRSF